jgi:uncharacterized cupin superfamily protein
MPAGSSTVPALAIGEVDTGLYQSTPGNLDITIDGTTAVAISAGGNIGAVGQVAASDFYGEYIRLNGTGDVTVSSTTHAFQIGDSANTNIAIDTNEIAARNNGASSTLALNSFGGSVTIGGTGGTTAAVAIRATNTTVTGNLTVTSGTTAVGTLTTGTVQPSGNIIPTTNGTLNLGSTSNRWNLMWGTATSAQWADLAEKYLADDEYPIGTVMSVGGELEVTASSNETAHCIVGVVSGKPAYLMNDCLEGGTAIALKGRVPVLVIGEVKKGDRLTVSNQPGYARADNDARWTFAIALHDSNGEETVEAIIL